MLFIHSPIDDGSGFIGVWWARHLDFGHGVNVQTLSITNWALMMGGGVIIAVAARRLLRSDTATRSETERATVHWRAEERPARRNFISPRRKTQLNMFLACNFTSYFFFLHHEVCIVLTRIYLRTNVKLHTRSKTLYHSNSNLFDRLINVGFKWHNYTVALTAQYNTNRCVLIRS